MMADHAGRGRPRTQEGVGGQPARVCREVGRRAYRGAESVKPTPALSAIVSASLLALAIACSGAEELPSGPRLVMERDSFDVGVIRVGETVERTVEFRNEGQEPLMVSIVRVRPAPDADCGCGVEGFEVRPKEVPPGGSGELVFTLKAPEGMEDTRDKMRVELESNDPSNPQPTITLLFSMAPPETQGG